MSTEKDINEFLRNRRSGVKGKMRGIASFHEKALARTDLIFSRIFPQKVPLQDWEIRQAKHVSPGEYEYLEDWRPFQVGDEWGGERMSAFFRRDVTVPEQFDGKPIVLRLHVGGGDSLVSIDGEPYHGLDWMRFVVPLTDNAEAGKTYHVDIESYIAWHGLESEPMSHTFGMAELATFDQEVWNAYWDLRCAEKGMDLADIDENLRRFLESSIWSALKLVPLQSNDDVILRKSILQAGEAIRKDVYESDCFRGDGLMYLVGHSHLDIVFLWPYKEYLRKAARTHTTVLRLMEQYPQFKFCQSQPKLYADLKEHYPTVYEQIKQRIAEGRWEPIGAMWVEPDCNLISGESFVRQILHGQRFYEQEFGMRSRTCWLPDVFGLSWALPQILARSGIEYAITNKMVPWNDTNPWQKNTVWWEGADGSRVLGIVPPGHFIGTVDPDVIDAQWRAFSDQQTVGQTLHVYGWGDGGGGPDPEMIESGQRYQDFPGLAKMKFAHAEEAFDNIAERVAEVGAPVHRDEIYLEAHRGMHTTRGKLKMLNRRMEFLLRSAELAAAMAWVDGADYPLEEINEAWQRTLTAQFHDSLPGTHVAEVYPMLLGEYDRAGELARDIRDEAMRALLGNGSTDTLTVFNPLDRERNDHIAVAADILKGRTVLDHGGKPLPGQQVITLAGEEKVLFRVGEFPAVGYGTFALEQVSQAPAADGGPTAEDKALENEYLRAVFNESGELVRLYDKQADREVLLDKRASNVFRMYEDTPGHYEAWDIVDTYREHEIALQRIANIAVDEQGPIRASLMIEKTLGNSKLRQRVSLYAGSRQLVFETEIDWLERQRLLKVGFDVDVNARTATYDIAYGHIERANHRNTTQDAARFEVNGHLWADLSQADCGVSILTDSKYGYEIEEKRMQLTLLKGPTYPDPDSDREMHHFTYALLPHTGDWRAGGTHDEALKLNDPMLALPSNANAGQCVSLFRCDAETLYLEAMKRSEDGEGLVLRLLERHNARARGTLTFDRPVHAAWSCDLMEDNRTELPIEDGRVKVDAKPCEIVTVYVQFR